MKPGQANLKTASELRLAFDQAFASPPSEPERDVEDVLAMRIAEERFVLRLHEIAGIQVDRKLVPLPSPMKELLGIVGLRGVMVPIYDLAAMLGYAASHEPRWLVLARAPKPIGFACGAPETLLRLPRSDFAVADAERAEPRAHLAGLVRIDGRLRPVIDMASVLCTLDRTRTLHARSRG
jgi:purine-binding chemotaxis protein CheW